MEKHHGYRKYAFLNEIITVVFEVMVFVFLFGNIKLIFTNGGYMNNGVSLSPILYLLIV